MSQWHAGPVSLAAGEAIPQYSIVSINASGEAIMCDLAAVPVGVAVKEAYASGDVIAIQPLSSAGTIKAICGEAVDLGDPVYTENGGKIQDTAAATSYSVGVALEAGGANEIIEVLVAQPGAAN